MTSFPANPRTVQLARRIIELAARAAWPRGRHVTETELVHALRVSRTPVRAALRLLATRGAMEARRNRGFFLLLDGGALAALHIPAPATGEEMLHERMLRDRIAGALPAEVTAAQLTERYSAGRSTLTRVLGRMADEGLMARGGGQAWAFAPTLEGEGGVRASYAFRLLVEPAAILLPGFTVAPDELGRQRRRHLDLVGKLGSGAVPAPAELFELDAGFHEAVAEFSGNPFVANSVRQQNALRRLLEYGSYGDRARVLAWCREHVTILDMLEQSDIGGAAEAMRRHLERARAIALDG